MNVLERVPVREQDPLVRATNFEEVCFGYNKEEATKEAERCLNCKNPQCVKGCPVNIQIPDFIKALKEDDLEKAGEVIHRLFCVLICIVCYVQTARFLLELICCPII